MYTNYYDNIVHHYEGLSATKKEFFKFCMDTLNYRLSRYFYRNHKYSFIMAQGVDKLSLMSFLIVEIKKYDVSILDYERWVRLPSSKDMIKWA